MSPWQLHIALPWRRVEVLAVSCSGYAVQVIAADGRVQALRPVTGALGSAPSSLAAGGALMIHWRGTRLAGCSCAASGTPPGPLYESPRYKVRLSENAWKRSRAGARYFPSRWDPLQGRRLALHCSR
jgi:hypothetical protein